MSDFERVIKDNARRTAGCRLKGCRPLSTRQTGCSISLLISEPVSLLVTAEVINLRSLHGDGMGI